MKVTEIGKLLGQKWKEESEEVKKKYEEKAADMKKKYTEEMEAWKKRKQVNDDSDLRE